jgi:hypothetical protein
MNKYAVFSFVTDRTRDLAVPVGVVAWSPEEGWHEVRFIKEDEPVTGLNPDECLPYVALVQDKLDHWRETGQLPYMDVGLRPCEDAWWLHVRKLLNHEIRLSEARELPAGISRQAVESLFLSVATHPRDLCSSYALPPSVAS